MLRIFQKPHFFFLNLSVKDCTLFHGKVQNVSLWQMPVSSVHYLSKFSSDFKSSSLVSYRWPKLLQGCGQYTYTLCKLSLERKASTGSNVDGRDEDVKYVMEMIVEKMNKIGRKISKEDYAKMAQKLEILQRHGCIISHVPEYLGVLNLSEEEIKKQAEKMKAAFVCLLTPDLFLETHASKGVLKRRALYQLKKITGIKQTDDLLKMKFDCKSKEEWNRLQPYLHRQQESVSLMFYKVDYLQQQGLSIDAIKKHPKVLKQDLKKLSCRMEKLQKMFPFLNPQIQLLLCEFKSGDFLNLINMKRGGLERYVDFFEGCKTKEEAAAKLCSYNDMDKEMHKRIQCLTGLGISPLCIVENIYCLRMGVVHLNKAIKQTKEKYGEVEDQCLMSEILEILQDRKSKPVQLSETTVQRIQNKVQLNEKELKDLQQSMSSVSKSSFYRVFLLKMDFLLREGYSVTDIRGCLQIFQPSLPVIKERLKKMRTLNKEGQPSLELLLKDNVHIRKDIDEYWSFLGQSKSKYDALTKLLQVDKLSSEVCEPLQYMKLKNLRPKIEYLLSVGIKGENILDDILCLRIPMDVLQNSVEELQKARKGEITLMQITRHAYKRMPNMSMRVFYKANLTFIQNKLSLAEKDMGLIQSKYLRNSSRVLQSNLKLLLNFGFTTEALRSCPYIIAHSTEVLEEYLNKLNTMKDVQMYEDLLTDKKKLVNFLQYLIEKNNYFCRVVNDDETLGDDEALLSLYYLKDGKAKKK